VPGTGGAPADESNRIYGVPGNPVSFRHRGEVLEAVRASLAGDTSFFRAVRVPYFDSKLAAYELAVEYRLEHDLPVVVVFPGTAVGAGDVGFSITRLVDRVYNSGLLFTLPGGTSFVTAQDAAAGIWMAGHQGRVGESYIISGRENDNLSYKQFMRLVATVARNSYNRRVLSRFVTIPAPLARGLVPLLRLLAPEGELNEGLILSGCVTHRFTSRKAQRELGYSPAVGMENAVQQCIDFYHRHGRASAG
jgi:nucleoside-diphosphate-sugar epimerase